MLSQKIKTVQAGISANLKKIASRAKALIFPVSSLAFLQRYSLKGRLSRQLFASTKTKGIALGVAVGVATVSSFGLLEESEQKEEPTQKEVLDSTEQVVNVMDGNTLAIANQTMFKDKVELYAVDAPEFNQPFGTEAREWVENKLLEEKVKVQVIRPEPQGNSQVLIYYLDDGQKQSLNHELVKNGLAWVNSMRCRNIGCRELLDLQLEARAEGVGLWEQDDPVAPWIWKRVMGRSGGHVLE